MTSAAVHSSEVEVTVQPENDPPVPVMPEAITIMQGEKGRLLGGHFVDFDSNDFAADPMSVIYQLGVEVGKGYVGLDIAAPNCSVFFRPVMVLPKAEVSVNVDARNDYKTRTIESGNGIFMSGTEVLTKMYKCRMYFYYISTVERKNLLQISVVMI